MKLPKILLASSLVLFGLTGCGEDKTAILTVNGTPVTQAQYDEAFNKEIQAPQYRQFEADLKEKDSLMNLMLRDRLVNELVLRTIINQEIEKRGIQVTEEEIEKRRAELIEQMGSKEKMQELLSKNGISEKKFEEDLENEIKVNKLIEASGNAKVTEKDAKAFYNANKASFNYPARVRASHILIEVNPAQIKQEIISHDKKGELTSEEINKKTQAAVDDKMKFAKEIRAKAAKDPLSFATLAKQYSDDKASAEKGGDLGFFTREAMVKPFSDAAFSLKPNTVSEVVVSDFGNHIIIVTDKAAAGVQPFDKMKEEIMAYLEQKKKIDVLKDLLNGLKASAKVEFVNPDYNVDNIQKMIKQKSAEQEKAVKDIKEQAKK